MKKKLQFALINAITSVRMAGIFLLIPIYLSYGGVALGLTNIACFLTDFADGKLARKFHLSTFFGSLYDGLADKSFLIVNMAILLSLSPYAAIPIALELGIAGLQAYKYKHNYNVQSNIIGKAKMWVAGISVVLCNLLIDADKLTFLGNSIISKLAGMGNKNIILATLTPFIVADVATFISYFKEMKDEDKLRNDQQKNKIETNVEVKDEKDEKDEKEEKREEILKEREKIEKEKQEILEKKEELISIKEALFSPTFYDEHKDDREFKSNIFKKVLTLRKEK